MYYLAYGSNLNLLSMCEKCPDAVRVGSGMLFGYKLSFKGSQTGYSYLTLEESSSDKVPFGVYKIGNNERKILDYYESYPDLYTRQTIKACFYGPKGKVVKPCLVYIMNPGFQCHLPSIDYFETCIEGYKDYGFDIDVLHKAYAEAEKADRK